MRILMVAQFWTPEPFLKALPFARELRKRGHEVEILTGFPNYPGGKVYPGYRVRLFHRDEIEGFRVNRVPLLPNHDRSGALRVLNYLSFAVSAAIIGPWVTKQADVLYVYHPPATVALPAKWLSILKRAPIVYDIQDLWPDTVFGTQMLPGFLFRFLDAYCRWVYRSMDRLCPQSPGFKRTLAQRGVPPEKMDVVFNWCDEDALAPTAPDPEFAKSLGLDNAFVVLFAGTMGIYQDLDTAIEAARILQDHPSNVLFVFVGGGIERDRLEERAKDVPNVHFLPRQPTEAMPALNALADVLLVHLRDEPLFEITIPGKTQASLYAGRPVLMAVKGDAADLVREAEAGIVCEPSNPTAMADAVLELIQIGPREREAMGRRGAQFYWDSLCLSKGADAFEAAFARAITDRVARNAPRATGGVAPREADDEG